jgi:uronate dehydrogenase
MQRVLITGAAGDIGDRLRGLLAGVYPVLRLSDVAPLRPAGEGEEVVPCDLRDAAAVDALLDGVDGVIHLGGIAGEAPFQDILDANIAGIYNLFEAARKAGTRRIVFASSNHAVGFYRRSVTTDHTVYPRPDSRYGLSKAFGEALGSLYADKHGLGVMCIRIGNANDAPLDERRLAIWISYRDLAQLCRIGLDHPGLHFEIVYGQSDNARSWWDNRNASRLGYRPQDRAEDHVDQAMRAQAALPPDPVGDEFQGGTFCSQEFDHRADALP